MNKKGQKFSKIYENERKRPKLNKKFLEFNKIDQKKPDQNGNFKQNLILDPLTF